MALLPHYGQVVKEFQCLNYKLLQWKRQIQVERRTCCCSKGWLLRGSWLLKSLKVGCGSNALGSLEPIRGVLHPMLHLNANWWQPLTKLKDIFDGFWKGKSIFHQEICFRKKWLGAEEKIMTELEHGRGVNLKCFLARSSSELHTFFSHSKSWHLKKTRADVRLPIKRGSVG